MILALSLIVCVCFSLAVGLLVCLALMSHHSEPE